MPLVRGWQHTVNPYYAPGQAKLAEVESATTAASGVTTGGPPLEPPAEPREHGGGNGPSALVAGLGVLGGVVLLLRLVDRR
jgi:hypothetical protein